MSNEIDLKLFMCTSYCEILAVQPVDLQYDEPQWWLIELAMYRSYGSGIRAKIRFIRDILKHGTPYLDDIVLSPGDARKLGEHLIGLANIIEAARRRLERRKEG